MQEQPKDEPKAQACPKCGGNMLRRSISSTGGVYFTGYPSKEFSTHASAAIALVCDNCGYAEIYATNPQNLRD